MELSEENRKTLLLSVHQGIEESADEAANMILHGRLNQLINYPPNGGFAEQEKTALMELKGNEDLKNALRKVIASTIAGVFFDFFNLIDGTADPDPEMGLWREVLLVNKPEDFDEYYEFLHDEFYETYWKWKEKRRNKNWSLDLPQEP
jgi:hypothetical protein